MLANAIPSNQNAIDAAIIDLDGTMVDTLDDFVAALSLTLDELGLPTVARDFVERTIGKGSEHLLRTTLAEVGADPDHYEAAWNAYQRHYLAVNGSQAQLFSGVSEGLQLLRDAGLRLACLTNKPTAFARPLLEAKGLSGFFERIYGGDAFERKKPHPLPLLETCKALGTVPARTLMVGDSRNDAEAAHAAGCPVVLVTYGYNHGEPIGQVPARLYLDRLDQWPAGWPLSPAGA
jgi:phosphoglycolate phosphatase